MIVAHSPFFEPVVDFHGLERLDLADSSSGPSSMVSADRISIDWREVDATVQNTLSVLTDQISALHPEIRSRPGHTSARAFFLFSYRVFDLGEEVEIDPVIVGLNFEPIPDTDRIRIQGDIGGDSTGRIDFEIEPVEVCKERAAILAAACRQARILAEQADVVSASVLARHGLPDY